MRRGLQERIYFDVIYMYLRTYWMKYTVTNLNWTELFYFKAKYTDSHVCPKSAKTTTISDKKIRTLKNRKLKSLFFSIAIIVSQYFIGYSCLFNNSVIIGGTETTNALIQSSNMLKNCFQEVSFASDFFILLFIYF